MVLSVESKELDEFCPQLFRTLDGLGLLPLQLWAKPNEFEKHPRLLFGSIQRYNDVEAGFKEWESRILRDATYRKEKHYLDLEVLRQRMTQRARLFTDNKANMQHLRTSLYARVFQYLYPRRVLANAFCEKHKGNPEAIEPEFLAKALPESIEADIKKLRDTYNDEWDTIVADARASLVDNAAYYLKVLQGKEPATLSQEEIEKAEEAERREEEEVS